MGVQNYWRGSTYVSEVGKKEQVNLDCLIAVCLFGSVIKKIPEMRLQFMG
jgi:hypothetical protein